MMPVAQITSCTVVGATSVRLKFRDGWTGTLDLGPALSGRIFGELKQPGKFRAVRICDGTLVWPNGADICPDVLRYWCELGRVCSQRETDQYFTQVHQAVLAVRQVAEPPGKYVAKRKR